MKVAVITITRDRLEYTKRAFEALHERAGHPFGHIVVDNGSADGSVKWLREVWLPNFVAAGNFGCLRAFPENHGIGAAWADAVGVALADGADLIVKLDNDAEVVTPGILASLVEVFGETPALGPLHILSPRVEGINRQPRRVSTLHFGKWAVGFTGMVGGLCLATTAEFYRQYRFPLGEIPKARGWDSHLCDWARRRGARTGYVEDLVVAHMDGTDGQAKKFPDYFARKRREEEEV